MFKNLNVTALAISGGLIYLAMSGMVKNKGVQTGLLAVGAVGVARQLPLVGTVVGGA